METQRKDVKNLLYSRGLLVIGAALILPWSPGALEETGASLPTQQEKKLERHSVEHTSPPRLLIPKCTVFTVKNVG